jgi:VWFA-related protein
MARRLAHAALAIALVVEPRLAGQQPTFRSTVDLIAVDVQVVDGNGRPIPRLGADRFAVEINGQKRRVVSVDFVEHTDPDAPARLPRSVIDSGHPGTAPPRVYVLGVDVASFSVAESRAIIEGARDFIKRLQPEDSVGIYAFPIGPKYRPSTDHAAILRQLDTIIGSREALHNSHALSPIDVIDIMAEIAKSGLAQDSDPLPTGRGQQAQASRSETLDQIVSRECGPLDRPCAQGVLADAQGMSFVLQGQATETLSGLRQLVRALGTIDGRKTLVLLSAGMPVSDRPGGKPDVGELPRLLGQEAAGTNTTIYAVFLETAFTQMMSAKSQHPDRSFGDGREQTVFGRVMDEFTGASGGALLPVAQGTGSGQFERVLRETSSRYLLGVEPAPADRDGTLRQLKVKVQGLPRGTSVRSRLWVVVPKPRL